MPASSLRTLLAAEVVQRATFFEECLRKGSIGTNAKNSPKTARITPSALSKLSAALLAKR
jgi:hypothetical protein